MEIITVAFLVLVGILFPVAAIRSERRLRNVTAVSRSQLYLSTVLSSSILFAFAIGAGFERRVTFFGDFRWHAGAVALTLGWTLLQVGYFWYSLRQDDLEKRRFARLFAPRSRVERIQWIGVGLFAAVSEEIIYRAVLFGIFQAWVDEWIIAALASAAIFGISHAVQGVQGGLLAALVGLGNQAIVLVTGSLWYAIAAHFAYDLVAGLVIGAHAARYEPQPVPVSPPPPPPPPAPAPPPVEVVPDPEPTPQDAPDGKSIP